MFRNFNCGELNLEKVGTIVTLSGWVQKSRNLGNVLFIDLRDRYGITQLKFEQNNIQLFDEAQSLGREYVLKIVGKVVERESKNKNIKTGEIEVLVDKLNILNPSKTPPFTIEDKTDGGEELRMKYRYLDIRRNKIRDNLILRHKISSEARNYLNSIGFIDVETPYLIKSTPEGARDFIVPSRMNSGKFYALPQSPQTFKQLLMVAGIDKYYQIVKCFRDEDLRADRQPEFTQIDCEMSFVNQSQVLETFEGLIKDLIFKIKNLKLEDFKQITYEESISKYGTDKPDLRYDLEIINLSDTIADTEFFNFFKYEFTAGIKIESGSSISRKQIDSFSNYIKQKEVGGDKLFNIKINEDGVIKSSVDKFLSEKDKYSLASDLNLNKGDMAFFMSGERKNILSVLGKLRIFLAKSLDLINKNKFVPLWVIDFPLFEWDDENKRYSAMHHPFTAPKKDDIKKLSSNPLQVKANAYDLVLNGSEIGGGSIRIHNKELQNQIFSFLGFTEKEASKQFGFLMNAFEYGAPPHGGIAFGLDRLCAVINGDESIRDYIAFPKNNSGKDIMIESPSIIDKNIIEDLNLDISL
ncbi:MAG: aspartate--tRNA ligase [Flavobacteriales bacterium TMED84]|nr:MAG: aspartate--tRNA ligase [Flavobacteriales bacterium TMED84]